MGKAHGGKSTGPKTQLVGNAAQTRKLSTVMKRAKRERSAA